MKKIIGILSISFLLSAVPLSYAGAQSRHHYYHHTMSHRKKDALIGTGGGALTGSIISHDHSKGAIIGGVLGGGLGYLHGRHKDKETGRLRR